MMTLASSSGTQELNFCSCLLKLEAKRSVFCFPMSLSVSLYLLLVFLLLTVTIFHPQTPHMIAKFMANF